MKKKICSVLTAAALCASYVMPVYDSSEVFALTKLSEHFSFEEFTCNCGATHTISPTLINYLEKIFSKFNCSKAIVTSGYRCPSCDISVGGFGYGQHVEGNAADIIFYDKNGNIIDARYICCVAADLGIQGVANINRRYQAVHIDSRSSNKYWGDEIYGYDSIWYQYGPDGRKHYNFYEYFGLSAEEVYSHVYNNEVSKPILSIYSNSTLNPTKFSWNACENAEEYHLYVYPKGSNTVLLSTVVSGTSKEFALPQGDYSASVAAVNNTYGTNNFSERADFSVGSGEFKPTAVTSYNGHIYALYENLSYYEKARDIAKDMGGHLATITSQAENDAVTSLMANAKNSGYWLGGNDKASSRAWQWETGEVFSYNKWHSNEPNNAEENYIMIYKDGTWNDSRSDINHAFGFVLEIEPKTPAEIAEYGDHLYYRFDNYMNWQEANAYAKSIGSTLVDMSDDGEKKFINTLTKNNAGSYWNATNGSANYDKNKKGFICEIPNKVTSVSVLKYPDKNTYYIGDAIDLTGIELNVEYEVGESKKVTSDIIATADMNTIGEKDVTITYKGFTYTFPIRIVCPKPEINPESKTDSTVTFAWRGISIADSYIINVNGTEWLTVTDNRCQLTGLEPDTDYNIQVIARKGTTVLEKSEIKSVRTSPKVTFSGAGTEADPYQIANANDLVLMSNLINDRLSNKQFRSAYYILANDIDMTNVAINPIGSCTDGNNSYFTGNFNGNYKKITGLYINTGETSCAGLFGKLNSIKEENTYCAVSNLSVYGNINSASNTTGGIVGVLSGGASVYGCSFNGMIQGGKNSGGIVGTVSDGGIIDTCYHSGNIEGMECGGIVGFVTKENENQKSDAYIVGSYHHNGTINSGNAHSGGITGVQNTTVNYYNNFYEKTSCSGGIDGKTNDNAKAVNSIVLNELAETLGVPYAKNEDKSINNGAPVFAWQLNLYKFNGNGTESSPYLISSKDDLQILNEYLNNPSISYMFRNSSYLQTVDIDLSGMTWKPIASEKNSFFSGTYDGGFHIIKNMKVTTENGGFFGRVSGGTVANLSIENGSVKSDGDAGGIIAQLTDGGTIQNCSYTGEVSAKNAGGLVGSVYNGKISGSYQNGKITGTETAGGLVGTVSEHGAEINNSFHAGGTISAKSQGGIVGKSGGNENITNTYYLKSTISGTATDGGKAVNQTILSVLAETLGKPFVDDGESPVFAWQVSDVKSATMRGDVNCDSKISIADAVLLQRHILGSYTLNKQQFYNADMDNDKKVNVFDMVSMRKEIVKK